jgi:hypothetical protein
MTARGRIFDVGGFFLAISLASIVLASSGDRSAEFEVCVLSCENRRCPSAFLSWSLRFTGWTCTDDCRYVCMHHVTDKDQYKGAGMQQYFGKWPFWRFLGMQEPASVAFSVLNLAAHVQGARKLLHRVPDGHPMKYFYFTSAVISSSAWVWSAVFHTRGAFVH